MGNTKISDLTATTTLVDTDLLELASTSGSAFISRKILLSSVSGFVLGKLDATPLSIARGGTGGNTATAARSGLGLGSLATQDAGGVAITGGSITGITDLAVADGGTGASTAPAARSNLNAAAAGANTDITSITGSAAKLTTARTLSATGDTSWSLSFDGSANASGTSTLATVNTNVGTFGSATSIPIVTVNAKGLVTAVSMATVSSGSGTVTSFAFTNGAGITGAIANASTTPTLSLTLGAITPASVAATGTVTGSNLTGTNSGDQTLTGDVTSTGTGASTAATIGANKVTFAKFVAATQAAIVGATAAGNFAEQTPASARTILGVTTTGADTTYAFRSNNLSDLANVVTARSNLGAAKSGANSDITSIAGLTTALSVAQGGTGDTGTAWTAYTPTIGAGGGTFTTASGSGAYKQIGKTVMFRVTVTITTNGSANSFVTATPPVPGVSAEQFAVGREMAATGALLTGVIQSNSIIIQTSAGGYPGADNRRLLIQGSYEAA